MLHRVTVVVASLLILAAVLLAPASSRAADRLCFSQVPDCIEGRFAEFWQQNGGLSVFGLPKSPAAQQTIEGRTFLVQQFERNRFELHPENARPYDVLLSRLGDDLLKRGGRDWQTFPRVGGAPANCLFFAETGHSICDPFLRVYRANGLEFDGARGKSLAESLALFGLPLSEPQVETLSDGRSYTIQWYERARFESHPENQPPYDVLLGLLGNESLTPPPAPTPTPGPPPLPESQNAIAIPERGPGGTLFVFAGRGFQPGENVGIYVTTPDQSVGGASFQAVADDEGIAGVVFQTANNPVLFPAGVWAMTFEGIETHNKAIAYFEITYP